MSPYPVTLVELVSRFATSQERKDILAGFLAHRTYLMNLGVTGIQWLDGSFLEDVEKSESRSPRDIDVVTFVVRPIAFQVDHVAWAAFASNHLVAFDSQQAKTAYKTDAYFVDIAFGPGPVISQTAYWLGLFSHKRSSGLWKGMLQIPLDAQQDDAAALNLLSTM